MRRVGLIGGTGLDQFGPPLRAHAIDSVYGQPSAALAEYRLGQLQVFFLPRHGERHQIPPHAVNYRANIHAFRQLDVEGIVAVNAVVMRVDAGGGVAKNLVVVVVVVVVLLPLLLLLCRVGSVAVAAVDALPVAVLERLRCA